MNDLMTLLNWIAQDEKHFLGTVLILGMILAAIVTLVRGHPKDD